MYFELGKKKFDFEYFELGKKKFDFEYFEGGDWSASILLASTP